MKEGSGKIRKRAHGHNATLHWRIALISFASAFVVLIGISIFTYERLSKDAFFNESAVKNESAEKIPEEKLSATLDYFRSKEAASASLKSNGISVVDPSR